MTERPGGFFEGRNRRVNSVWNMPTLLLGRSESHRSTASRRTKAGLAVPSRSVRSRRVLPPGGCVTYALEKAVSLSQADLDDVRPEQPKVHRS